MNLFFSKIQCKRCPDVGDSNSVVPSPIMTCTQGNLESSPKRLYAKHY